MVFTPGFEGKGKAAVNLLVPKRYIPQNIQNDGYVCIVRNFPDSLGELGNIVSSRDPTGLGEV
jgi:hypothetical protein